MFGLFLLPQSVFGQQSSEEIEAGDEVRILLKEGTEINGTIMAVTDVIIEIQSKNLGLLRIERMEIERITNVELQKDIISPYPFENPFPTRNYLTETALGLKEGEKIYKDTFIRSHPSLSGRGNCFPAR